MRNVKRRVPWVGHVINKSEVAGDLNIDSYTTLGVKATCLACRGGRLLCGKFQCPILLRLYSFLKVKDVFHSKRVFGSSPPGAFVGRMGYPHVYAGPLVPPVVGDTSLFNMPEKWLGKSVDEIVDFRTNLIRGKFIVNVKKPSKNQRFARTLLEMALSKASVDTELTFRKNPRGGFLLDNTLQPMGPSGMLTGMTAGASKTDFVVEKAYADGDLKAEDAVLDLYLNGLPVSRIQRVFSLGAFGLKERRRMVPTRWSITAIDSILSRRLIEDKVKGKRMINEHRVYEFNYLGNRFVILLIPSSWRYEWIEAWYPGTTWNPQGRRVSMGGDWEGYNGRTTYASIGGCYYSVRLAAAEFLSQENRQAGVIAMREIHPSFTMPLGVWINRESIRAAFKQKMRKFDTLREAISYIKSRFTIAMDAWIEASSLLKDALYQERIIKYF